MAITHKKIHKAVGSGDVYNKHFIYDTPITKKISNPFTGKKIEFSENVEVKGKKLGKEEMTHLCH